MSFTDGDYDQIMNICMTVILMTICVCGVCGNAIVLAVAICKRKYQNNVTNCYIINLAVTDLLFLLISVPLTAYLGLRQTWIFGEFMCKIHIYLAHVLLQATCYTLAAMSLDRYLNIVHVTCYRRWRTPKHAFVACLLIWAATILFMFPYEHFTSKDLSTKKSMNNTSSPMLDCTVNNTDSFFSSCLFTFGFYYVLPLSIIGLCYSRVSLHVRRMSLIVAIQLTGKPRQSVQLKRRRVRRLLFGLILAFALCWLPIHILELLNCSHVLSQELHRRHPHVMNTARLFAHVLSYFNSCLNPFLYATLNKGFFRS